MTNIRLKVVLIITLQLKSFPVTKCILIFTKFRSGPSALIMHTPVSSTARIASDEMDQNDGSFFYYLMLTMPVLALAAYIYDACSLFISNNENGGLLSSVLFIFYFLHYSVTINSRWLLTVYQFLIGSMVIAGDIIYVLYHLKKNNQIQLGRYAAYILLDFVFNLILWICKILTISKAHKKNVWYCTRANEIRNLNQINLRLHIKVHQRQFFSFLSRLEAIVATLIPIFFSDKIARTTSANIGFFILFDFFSKSFYKLDSVWIKTCLYLFISTVTASIVTEWLYYMKLEIIYSQVSGLLELLAACWCYMFIILQFFPSHFRAQYRDMQKPDIQIKNDNYLTKDIHDQNFYSMFVV